MDKPNTFKQGTFWVSIVSLLVSGLSFWQAHSAYTLNYVSNLPAISHTASLIEPPKPGQQMVFRLVFKNDGKTVAKNFEPTLRFQFAPIEKGFSPDYRATDEHGV